MTLQIPIQEAISLIREKSGKDIRLMVVDNNTMNVGYEINKKVPIIGNVTKKVDVNVFFYKVVDNNLYLRYSTGIIGGDMIVNMLLSAYPSFSSSNVVEKDDDGGLIVHLANIRKLTKVCDSIDIQSITFGSDNAIMSPL